MGSRTDFFIGNGLQGMKERLEFVNGCFRYSIYQMVRHLLLKYRMPLNKRKARS